MGADCEVGVPWKLRCHCELVVVWAVAGATVVGGAMGGAGVEAAAGTTRETVLLAGVAGVAGGFWIG